MEVHTEQTQDVFGFCPQQPAVHKCTSVSGSEKIEIKIEKQQTLKQSGGEADINSSYDINIVFLNFIQLFFVSCSFFFLFSKCSYATDSLTPTLPLLCPKSWRTVRFQD